MNTNQLVPLVRKTKYGWVARIENENKREVWESWTDYSCPDRALRVAEASIPAAMKYV